MRRGRKNSSSRYSEVFIFFFFSLRCGSYDLEVSQVSSHGDSLSSAHGGKAACIRLFSDFLTSGGLYIGSFYATILWTDVKICWMVLKLWFWSNQSDNHFHHKNLSTLLLIWTTSKLGCVLLYGQVLMLQRELLGVNEVYRRLSAEAKMLGLVKMEREKL